jgi:dienelactone hydrolase
MALGRIKFIGMKKSGDVVFMSSHGRKSVYDLRFFENMKPKPLLIFCHGFKGFKDWGHFNLIADEFCASGMIVLKFNFTFNGGTIDQVTDFPDLEAFAENNYLKELEDIHHIIHLAKIGEIPLYNWNGEIFLLGHSRGGGMATIAAFENKNVTKVVSWAGISDCLKRIPKEKELLDWKLKGVKFILNGRTQQKMPMNYQFIDSLLDNKNRASIEKASKNINKPHLIIHGSNDSAVDQKEAISLNKWSEKSEIEIIKGANHVFGGKHPWNEKDIPEHTKIAVHRTLKFLLD